MKKIKYYILVILLVSTCLFIYINYNKNNEKEVLLSNIYKWNTVENSQETSNIIVGNFKTTLNINSNSKVKKIDIHMNKDDKDAFYKIYSFNNGNTYIRNNNNDKYIFLNEKDIVTQKNLIFSFIIDNENLLSKSLRKNKNNYIIQMQLKKDDISVLSEKIVNDKLLDEMCKAILVRQKIELNKDNICKYKNKLIQMLLLNLNIDLELKFEENKVHYNLNINNLQNNKINLNMEGTIIEKNTEINLPDFDKKDIITLEDYFFIR